MYKMFMNFMLKREGSYSCMLCLYWEYWDFSFTRCMASCTISSIDRKCLDSSSKFHVYLRLLELVGLKMVSIVRLVDVLT
jgi:hypothetical protein